MSTSLAEQLQRLAVPQTTRLLHRDKSRPSLLFDPKEAATLDRDTVYEIGISGLEELQKCNYLFKTFERNLFSITSKSFERSVENVESNEKLNEQIKKFLLLLSPYFMLKCAHKALEWLVNRYHIHEYNKEELLMLILPYHETNIFVRCLQLISMKENDKWHWLKVNQKKGLHLPKAVLFNRCAGDAYFLNFVCRMTMDTMKYHEKPSLLTVMFNFYCTAITGGLEHSKSVGETQITQMLPCIMAGLSSNIPDFIAATYVILAKLLAKVQLGQKPLKKFVDRICNVSSTNLHTEAALLLVIIYQSQGHFRTFPSKTVNTVAGKTCRWMVPVLEKLRASGSHVLPFLKAVTYQVFSAVLEDPMDDVDAKGFVDMLTSELKLEDAFVEVYIGNLLELFDPKVHSTSAHVAWLESFLRTMENGNASAFDRVVQKHLKGNEDTKQRKNLVRMLKMSVGSESFDIVEKLYHPNPKFRMEALGFLIKKVGMLCDKDMELLKNSLTDRLNDDDPAVIVETLRLCNEDIGLEFFDYQGFSEGLLQLAGKCAKRLQMKDYEWKQVVQPLVTLLCSEPVRQKMNNDLRLFFVLLPFLFPDDEDQLWVVQMILKSSFGRSDIFNKLPETLSAQSTNMSVGKDIMENLNAHFFALEAVLPIYQEICQSEGDILRKYLSTLVIAYALQQQTAMKSALIIIETVMKLLRGPRVKYVAIDDSVTAFDAWNSCAHKGYLPLQGLLFCMQIFTQKFTGHVEFDFSSDTLVNKFVITYLDFLLQNCTSSKANKENQYSNLLKQFLKKICKTFDANIVLLCNVAMCNNLYRTDALSLRCLRLVGALLESFTELSNTLVGDIVVPTVLISLVNPLPEIRQAAMDLAASVFRKGGDDTAASVLYEILNSKEEILLDSEQLPLILYSVLVKSIDTLNVLLDKATDKKKPGYFIAAMFCVLQHINTYEIFQKTSSMAYDALFACSNVAYSEIVYRNILRFSPETAGELQLNTKAWEFIEKALSMDETRLDHITDKAVFPSALLLNQIDKECFAKLNENVQKELLNLIARLASETQNANVISALNRAIKRIDLDVKLLRPVLEAMRDVQPQKEGETKRKRRVRLVPTADVLETLQWRKGLSVLEFLQDKKKIRNTNSIVPILFDLLHKCLEFDEQGLVEYPKQLLLSSILNCSEKMSDHEREQSRAYFNVELVVQCVRASQNPQTHHHALLVLAQAANVIPQQLLHHIMSVFTFMGSSILRHDDAYSSQLITKIIDTIIPILVSESVPAVLRVFVDALLDIPEHRRIPLLNQLMVRLGPLEYLWMFLVLVFEAQVLRSPSESKSMQPLAKVRGVEAAQIVKKRLDISADLCRQFDPVVIIETCIKVVEYLRKLPEEKDDPMDSSSAANDMFNIATHTAKQFRHFKYVIVTFISQLLASKEFVTQVAQLNNEKMMGMEEKFKNLVINVLTFIGQVSKTADKNVNSPQNQYWKVMLHHSYDLLDSANALLTCQMFLLVIRGLMVHNIAAVRRRALELLNTKLQQHLHQQSTFFDHHDDDELFSLLQPLLSIIKGIDAGAVDSDQELIQQTSFLSLKLIVRLKGAQHPDKFIPILNFVTDLMRSERAQGNILASMVLCLAELCSNLRAHAIPNLSKFMPALIKVLRNQRKESPNLLLLSLITAVQKILDSLPLFLSPYLEKLIAELAMLTAKLDAESEDPKLAPFVAKIKIIKTKLGSAIPTRVLLPALSNAYSALVEKERYASIGPLMLILSENLTNLQGADVNAMLPDLTTFFLSALQFRADKTEVEASVASLNENYVIQAFSTFILKLSETSFRPVYYKICDWAVRSETKTERVITFYNFSQTIAKNLKGLFVLFAGHFLNNVAMLLDACNSTKSDALYFEDVSKDVLLLEYILQTLHSVFLYDSQKFVNKERFDILMQPLVDQLENVLDGEEALQTRAHGILTPCIVQFSVATADDALWKQMNYQILLKTRHSSSVVRLVALECLEEVTKKLGEDFLPLLPETIPFLAEMLEDEDENVEKATQKAIQQMEKVLGEPLRKYF